MQYFHYCVLSSVFSSIICGFRSALDLSVYFSFLKCLTSFVFLKIIFTWYFKTLYWVFISLDPETVILWKMKKNHTIYQRYIHFPHYMLQQIQTFIANDVSLCCSSNFFSLFPLQ